jgi:hypothetical protein
MEYESGNFEEAFKLLDDNFPEMLQVFPEEVYKDIALLWQLVIGKLPKELQDTKGKAILKELIQPIIRS